MSKYQLDDVVLRNRLVPTFEIPSVTDRMSLVTGDMAKCVFLNTPERAAAEGAAERMWVEVTGRKWGEYTGTLSNAPSFLPLAFGDAIHFGPQHVIDIRSADAAQYAAEEAVEDVHENCHQPQGVAR